MAVVHVELRKSVCAYRVLLKARAEPGGLSQSMSCTSCIVMVGAESMTSIKKPHYLVQVTRDNDLVWLGMQLKPRTPNVTLAHMLILHRSQEILALE